MGWMTGDRKSFRSVWEDRANREAAKPYLAVPVPIVRQVTISSGNAVGWFHSEGTRSQTLGLICIIVKISSI